MSSFHIIKCLNNITARKYSLAHCALDKPTPASSMPNLLETSAVRGAFPQPGHECSVSWMKMSHSTQKTHSHNGHNKRIAAGSSPTRQPLHAEAQRLASSVPAAPNAVSTALANVASFVAGVFSVGSSTKWHTGKRWWCERATCADKWSCSRQTAHSVGMSVAGVWQRGHTNTLIRR
jgi:hypothetical protein